MAGLVVAAIFAASMDSNLNSMATLTLCDLYQRYFRPNAGERESMLRAPRGRRCSGARWAPASALAMIETSTQCSTPGGIWPASFPAACWACFCSASSAAAPTAPPPPLASARRPGHNLDDATQARRRARIAPQSHARPHDNRRRHADDLSRGPRGHPTAHSPIRPRPPVAALWNSSYHGGMRRLRRLIPPIIAFAAAIAAHVHAPTNPPPRSISPTTSFRSSNSTASSATAAIGTRASSRSTRGNPSSTVPPQSRQRRRVVYDRNGHHRRRRRADAQG